MRYMRKTAGYSLIDHKTNMESAKQLNRNPSFWTKYENTKEIVATSKQNVL
jgi:hypothetical protein